MIIHIGWASKLRQQRRRPTNTRKKTQPPKYSQSSTFLTHFFLYLIVFIESIFFGRLNSALSTSWSRNKQQQCIGEIKRSWKINTRFECEKRKFKLNLRFCSQQAASSLNRFSRPQFSSRNIICTSSCAGNVIWSFFCHLHTKCLAKHIILSQ